MQPACCIRLGYFSYCNVTLLQYRDIGPWFWLSKAIAFRCWECLVENVVQFMGMEEGLVLMDMKEYTIVKILLSSNVASLFFWKQICKYCMWLRWWFSYRLHNLSFFSSEGLLWVSTQQILQRLVIMWQRTVRPTFWWWKIINNCKKFFK